MNVKRPVIFIVLMLTAMIFVAQNTFALDYGDTAPKIQVSKWFKNKPEQYLKNMKDNKNNSVVVLCIWATWSDTTENVFGFINSEVGIYSKENVVFIALSKENQRIIDRYIRTNEDIKFSVAADDDSKTYDKYMVNTDGVPMFFVIGKRGDIIWKGSPFELDRVLSRVVTNTFDNEKEKKIEKIRGELQKSIQYMNFERQAELAQRILDIDPLDQTAINILTDNYIRKNQIEEAIKFMLGKINKASYNKYIDRVLYFNLLTIFQGMNSEVGQKYLLETTKRFYAAFKNEPEALNSYCIALVQSMPMEIVPLKETYDMMNSAIDLSKKLHPDQKENLGLYYRTLAKIYYMVGSPTKAIEAQDTSVKLINEVKNSNNEFLADQGELLLKHYKTIKKLQKSLK
jgi:hypothetical protein